MDEEGRECGACGHRSCPADGRIFERARGRGPDGNHAPALLLRGIDRGSGSVADLVRLRIDQVILDTLGAYRLERAVPDMKRDRGALDAPRGQVVEHLRREVESGSRRCHRAAV